MRFDLLKVNKMKRILSCTSSDFQKPFTREVLKQAIEASEGRVIMSQTAVESECLISNVSNAEMLSSFGSDMVLLKVIDVEHPKVAGIESNEPVKTLKKLCGRLIGVNLEVVGENHLQYESGTTLSETTIQKAVTLQPDFLCLTAYRNRAGNTSEAVLEAIALVRKYWDGLLILNKYANAKELKEEKEWEAYVARGADVLTLPMPGSVSGVYVENLAPIAQRIKEAGALVSMSVATSQEGSDVETIKRMGIEAKQAGADLYDFGDANTNGIPALENVLALSIAVRGKRHTYFRIGSSIQR